MRKKMTALLVGAMLMMGAASAWALPSEWGIINPTATTGTPSFSQSTDFGYYIWTDDLERTSWHMRWVDGTHPGITIFSGLVSLENNQGNFDTFSFETGTNGDISISDTTGITFISRISTGVDGIDFTITQDSTPSYVGFDLNYGLRDMNPNNIFIGGTEQTVFNLGEDQDFAIAAPVPEPGTMMLLGAGFLGLAIYGKRRKNA